MNDIEIKHYREFMYNKNNIHRCDECPANREFDDHNDRKPCGQYNCWVSVHCYPNKYHKY